MSKLFLGDDSQSVGRDQDENPGVGSMSSHLYKERKGGQATELSDTGEHKTMGIRPKRGTWLTKFVRLLFFRCCSSNGFKPLSYSRSLPVWQARDLGAVTWNPVGARRWQVNCD